MPEVSRFLGIAIVFYLREHPPPHFHAVYGDYEISVTIADGVVSGHFPRRALRLVLEWYDLHRDDLAENWQRARAQVPLKPIPPLE